MPDTLNPNRCAFTSAANGLAGISLSLAVLSWPAHADIAFINFTEPPGYSMLARHLDVSNLGHNTVGNLIPNGTPPQNGWTIFTMDAGGFRASNYLDGWSDPNLPVRPGDAWFFKNPFATNTSFVVVGYEVDGTNGLPAEYSAASSIYPIIGLMNFPAASGDVIYLFNNADNTYSGYTNSGTWLPSSPSIQVGQSFWVKKSAGSQWIQTNGSPAGRLDISQPALTSTAGQLNFFTYNATNLSLGRVQDGGGIVPLSTNGLGQLYAGTTTDDNSFVALGAPVSFSGEPTPGYIRGGTVSVPFANGGQSVYVQLRAWEQVDGATYEAAVANAGNVARSTVVLLTAHATIENNLPGIPPPDVNLFPVFSLPVELEFFAQPQSRTNLAGTSALFSVLAAGPPPVSYQWRFAGAILPGATSSSFTRTNVAIANAGSYDVVVTCPSGSITSAVATLTVMTSLAVNAAPVVGGTVSNYPGLSTYPGNSSVLLTALPNPGWGFVGWTGDATGAGNPISMLMVTNKVVTANFAPLYSLTLFTNGGGTISRNPDQSLYISNSLVQLTAAANPGWAFTGWSGNASGAANPMSVAMTNNKSIAANFASAPTISLQPQSQTVIQDGNATFFVSATSQLPLSYRWRFNGGNIAGANADSYTRSAVQSSDGGNYDVVVTNAAGSVTSAVAVLTVFITPPTIIAHWNFNSMPTDIDLGTGTNAPAFGHGTASLVGGVVGVFQAGDTTGDPAPASDNTAWVTDSYPSATSANKTAGIRFDASTVGYEKISVSWRQHVTSQASKYVRLQYTTNGSTFIDFPTPDAMTNVGSYESKSNNLSSITSVNGKAAFGIRIVTEFESTATGAGLARYVTVTGSGYSPGGDQVFDMVTIHGEPVKLAATLYPLALVSGNNFQVGITGAVGASYIVQLNTNLTSTNWSAVLTNTSPFIFTEGNVVSPQRYYRALFIP